MTACGRYHNSTLSHKYAINWSDKQEAIGRRETTGVFCLAWLPSLSNLNYSLTQQLYITYKVFARHNYYLVILCNQAWPVRGYKGPRDQGALYACHTLKFFDLLDCHIHSFLKFIFYGLFVCINASIHLSKVRLYNKDVSLHL